MQILTLERYQFELLACVSLQCLIIEYFSHEMINYHWYNWLPKITILSYFVSWEQNGCFLTFPNSNYLLCCVSYPDPTQLQMAFFHKLPQNYLNLYIFTIFHRFWLTYVQSRVLQECSNSFQLQMKLTRSFIYTHLNTFSFHPKTLWQINRRYVAWAGAMFAY